MMDLMMNMPGAMDGPMGGWDAGFWWPFMLVRLLLWGVFLSLLVWFAVRMFSRGRGDTPPGATKDSAGEILRERFARGEINAEEYVVRGVPKVRMADGSIIVQGPEVQEGTSVWFSSRDKEKVATGFDRMARQMKDQ